jgi:hypothetical protein
LLVDEVLRNSGGLIQDWKELGASKQWKLRGTVHHKEVAVNVNCRALRERLRETLGAELVNPQRKQGQIASPRTGL